jgi:hypothetical protein
MKAMVPPMVYTDVNQVPSPGVPISAAICPWMVLMYGTGQNEIPYDNARTFGRQ